MMQPVRGNLFWEETGKEAIAPPRVMKLPGRPKKARTRDPNEPRKKTGKLSRFGRVMTCRICKAPDHNIRRCPQYQQEGVNITTNRRKRNRNTNPETSNNVSASASLLRDHIRDKNTRSVRGRASTSQPTTSQPTPTIPSQPTPRPPTSYSQPPLRPTTRSQVNDKGKAPATSSARNGKSKEPMPGTRSARNVFGGYGSSSQSPRRGRSNSRQLHIDG
ncbi:uncharacterized protein LOC126656900 isoform X2 [Mercurialis annua]|uniref:uncharacterized protein LOC126656900 isoform X2 n=1 Tax=Mercurialis annua TaxID=3986 RepID=UPI0024AE6F02|nr:uncharacterized protein LOC126656900 isoform X2 [Mercurialis annua]